MEKQEDYRIKVEISNKKMNYPKHVYFASIVIGLTVWIAPSFNSLLEGILIFGMLSLIMLTIAYISERAQPSNSSRVFIITKDDRLLFHRYYREGISLDKFDGQIRMSMVWKAVLKNKRIKWIELWLKEKDLPDRPIAILSVPFLEKCNEEWQRLFDAICQRIPPEAEVIVK